MIFTTKYIVGGVVGLAIAIGTFSTHHPNPVCPENFGKDDAGSEQYLTATDKWTNDFFDAHPDATMTDWAQARYQFYIDNHCTAALKGYEDAKAGKADPKTMKMVDDILRDATQP